MWYAGWFLIPQGKVPTVAAGITQWNVGILRVSNHTLPSLNTDLEIIPINFFSRKEGIHIDFYLSSG